MQPADKIKEVLKSAVPSKENPTLEHLTDIGQIAQFILKLKVTNELEMCALEYCLVKMGTLAEELQKKKHEEFLKKYAESHQLKNMPEILTGLVDVRNCLADSFSRLVPGHHERFLKLQNNPILVWLANPVLLKAPFDNQAIAALHDIKAINTALQKKGRSSLDKLGSIVFFLDKIQNFCAIDNQLNNEETRCAVSMLMIAMGTSAREILLDNYLKQEISKGIKSYPDMVDWLDHFKRNRNLFAHLFAFSFKTEAWKHALISTITELPPCIKVINMSIQQWEKLVNEASKRPIKLNELPVVSLPPATASVLSSGARIIQQLPSGPPRKEVTDEDYEAMMKVILSEKPAASPVPVVQSPHKRPLTEDKKEEKEKTPEEEKKVEVPLKKQKEKDEKGGKKPGQEGESPTKKM